MNDAVGDYDESVGLTCVRQHGGYACWRYRRPPVSLVDNSASRPMAASVTGAISGASGAIGDWAASSSSEDGVHWVRNSSKYMYVRGMRLW